MMWLFVKIILGLNAVILTIFIIDFLVTGVCEGRDEEEKEFYENNGYLPGQKES